MCLLPSTLDKSNLIPIWIHGETDLGCQSAAERLSSSTFSASLFLLKSPPFQGFLAISLTRRGDITAHFFVLPASKLHDSET